MLGIVLGDVCVYSYRVEFNVGGGLKYDFLILLEVVILLEVIEISI